MQVRPLGLKDLLKKDMAAHSSILAQETPWTKKPGGPVLRAAKSGTQLSDSAHMHAEKSQSV